MNTILLLYMPTADQKMLPLPPLGISQLAGFLRNKGITAHIDDLEMKYWDRDITGNRMLKKIVKKIPLKYNNTKKIFLNMEKIEKFLDSECQISSVDRILREWDDLLSVDLTDITHVGFSVLGFTQLSTSLCFAKYLKGKYSIKTVFGGIFISQCSRTLIEKFRFIDYLVMGGGEFPLLQLLSDVPETKINNLIFRHNGRVVINGALLQEQKDVKPDFEGLPVELYQKQKLILFPYETSKGCRNNCKFCITRDKEVQLKDADKIISELIEIKNRYGVQGFIFFDNAINIDKPFSIELCNKFIEKNLNIPWSAYFIPEEADISYFRLLNNAGCIQLRWGIESTGEQVLKEMNKSFDTAKVSDAIHNSHAAGIWNHLLFIIGHPGEVFTDVFKTTNFIIQHRKCFKSACIYPFDFGRIFILGKSGNGYRSSYANGKFCDGKKLGIKFRIFKDRNLMLKYQFIKTVLLVNGLRLIGTFNNTKTRFEKRQYLYKAFFDSLINKAC